nr:hypothetical protein [Enterococcus faecalis]
MKEMRKNGPMVNRWLYGLMCLLLVLNYGTPLMALAEDVNSDGLQIEKVDEIPETLFIFMKTRPYPFLFLLFLLPLYRFF